MLSYFNPDKYHDHWEKTKLRNPEIHVSAPNSSPLEDQLGNIDLNTNYHSSKNRFDATKSRTDARHFKTDDFINVRADGNTSRKYAPFNRQFKFAAAINSLNEAHSSNEAAFRRARNHELGAMNRRPLEEASFDLTGTAYQQSFGGRGARYNGHSEINMQKRFINRL